MADAVTDAIDSITPTITGPGAVTIALIILLVIILFSATAIITYIVIKKRKFNKFVVVFEKVGGKEEVVMRCRAMFSKFGRGGDQVMILEKGKKVLPKPEIQVGRNNYWFKIREDGEWINIGIEDIDEKFRELKCNFLHPEIRYQKTSIQDGMLKERYQNTSWWKENWHIVVSIVVIAILLIFMFLITSKNLEIANAQEEGQKIYQDTMETTKQIIAGLNEIKNGGSGLVPAG